MNNKIISLREHYKTANKAHIETSNHISIRDIKAMIDSVKTKSKVDTELCKEIRLKIKSILHDDLSIMNPDDLRIVADIFSDDSQNKFVIDRNKVYMADSSNKDEFGTINVSLEPINRSNKCTLVIDQIVLDKLPRNSQTGVLAEVLRKLRNREAMLGINHRKVKIENIATTITSSLKPSDEDQMSQLKRSNEIKKKILGDYWWLALPHTMAMVKNGYTSLEMNITNGGSILNLVAGKN